MLTVKGIVKGNAVPMSPQESAVFAVLLAFSKAQDDNHIYWAMEKSVKFDGPVTTQPGDKKGQWLAHCRGTVNVGKTHKKTDRFHDAKPHTFSISFKNKLDGFGLPAIELVDSQLAPLVQTSAADAPEMEQA